MIDATDLDTLAQFASTVNLEPEHTAIHEVGDGVPLALHAFLPPDHERRSPTPAVVWFFGGGWIRGTITQFHRLSRYLAMHGIASICAEYRIRDQHHTTPSESVADACSLMTWIHTHGVHTWNLDSARIAAGGGSAGGHLATMTTAHLKANLTPSALVLFNPVLDTGPDGYGHERVGPDWKNLSPIHLEDIAWPPTCILLGTQDRILPIPTAERFRSSVAAAGSVCDLHLFGACGHGFFNADRFTETASIAARFLQRQLCPSKIE